MNAIRALLLVLAVSLGSHFTQAEDWPRWRGPRGDGTWNGPKVSRALPKNALNTVWRKKIGAGYAGVTVADGRVYVCDRLKEPKEVERVLCFDADSGKQLWEHKYTVRYGDLSYGTGPRAAPTVHDGKLYSLGALGHLFCLDAKTGRELWSLHLQKGLNGRMPMWGYAPSPFILDDLVIVQPGAKDGSVVALHRQTGKVVWKSLSDEAGYATPILVSHNGRRQLIVWTPSHIRSLDPKTGKPFWAVPYKVTYGVAIATPVTHRGILFISGYWEGSKAIQLGDKPADAKLLWEDRRRLRGLMSQPLCKDGFCYLLDKRYGVTGFELKTGKKVWDAGNSLAPRGRNPQVSLVRLNGTSDVLMLNSDGELILGEFTPEKHHEFWRTKIIGKTWAHPAYAGSRVYARSDTELVCVQLPMAGK